jgi:NitT/TauT family transport system permease protein
MAEPPAAARRVEAILLPLGAFAAAALGWHLAVAASGTTTFPSPAEVVRGVAELARRGVLLPYIGDSLARVGGGYALAVAAGVPAGLAMGWWPAVARAANPVVQVLRPISPLAWIPVSIVLFGIGELATVVLIFLAAVFPFAVAPADGVGGVPQVVRRAGRNFGLSAPALLVRVVMPAALPQVLGGLRIALGVAWLVVVAAEMIAVDSGLGYLVIDARNAGKRYDLVVAAILMIGLIGLALDLAARRLERLRPLRWGFTDR